MTTEVQELPSVKLAVVSEGVAIVSLTIPKAFLPSISVEDRAEKELKTIERDSDVSALASQITAWYSGNSRSLIITIPVVNPLAETDTLNRMMLVQHLGERIALQEFSLDLTNFKKIQEDILK